MSVKFVQVGDAVDYRAGSAVSAGDVVLQNDLLGVATNDIAAGALGAIAVSGVFDFPKTVGEAIGAGVKLYWDSAYEVATATAGANKYIGKSVAAAASADETVRVLLSQ